MTIKDVVNKLEKAAALGKIKVFRGDKNKIMIDLKGDGEPDAALIDTTGSEMPDLLAIDVNGDHKFNLFLDDTDDNNFPDVLYIDKKGDGNIQLLGAGEEVHDRMHGRLVKIFAVLTDRDADEEAVHDALQQLAECVEEIQKHAGNMK